MGKGASVLVIDDSAVWRKIIKKNLESIGFEIAGEASDGNEGIDKYIALKPDLVTMDIEMPMMDGMEATRRILEMDVSAKIVMVSSKGDESTVRKALLIGAMDFISKASTKEIWDAKLKKYVKKAHHRRTLKKILRNIRDIKPVKLFIKLLYRDLT